MKSIIIALVLVLIILHQDIWWWDDRTLIFGFLPIGLAWHALLSILAGIVGWIAVTFAWPKNLEQDGPGGSGRGGAH